MKRRMNLAVIAVMFVISTLLTTVVAAKDQPQPRTVEQLRQMLLDAQTKEAPRLPGDQAAWAFFKTATPTSSNTIVLKVGETLDLSLMNDAGSHAVVAQQTYWTFPWQILQNRDAHGQPSNEVIMDSTYLDTPLQNELCNGPVTCYPRNITTPPGYAAFASGVLLSPPVAGRFVVATTRLQAVAPGTGVIHFQFYPEVGHNRDSFIIDEASNRISDNSLYHDITVVVVPNK